MARSEVLAARRAIDDGVVISRAVKECLVDLTQAIRDDERVAQGNSTRSMVLLLPALQALALLRGRDYVSGEDIVTLAPRVLGHRVELAPGLADLRRCSTTRSAERSRSSRAAPCGVPDGGRRHAPPLLAGRAPGSWLLRTGGFRPAGRSRPRKGPAKAVPEGAGEEDVLSDEDRALLELQDKLDRGDVSEAALARTSTNGCTRSSPSSRSSKARTPAPAP